MALTDYFGKDDADETRHLNIAALAHRQLCASAALLIGLALVAIPVLVARL